jgi:hypothetical protein
MKQGDTITINKPGHILDGYETKIVDILPDCGRPVKINVHGDYFLTFKEAGVKSDKQIFNDYDRMQENKAVEKPEKRKYNKRSKEVKPQKEKRKYTRKAVK